MINIHTSKLGQSVYLTQLYDYLELNKAHYTHFVERNINKNDFAVYDIDYLPLSASNAKIGQRGRFRKEFEIYIDFAKKLCMVSRSKKGEEIRNELVELTKKIETGQQFSTEQINFLLELVPIMGLFSIQDISEKRHFDFHNNKYDWWDYRAKVLGYGTQQLRIEVEKLNRKYKSQKQALLHVDKYELIRIGVIDLFIALGKSVEYSSNVADLCKNIAIKMGINIWNDYNTTLKFPVKHNEKLESAIKSDKLKLKE
jgi:phage anti-repressor protein